MTGDREPVMTEPGNIQFVYVSLYRPEMWPPFGVENSTLNVFGMAIKRLAMILVHRPGGHGISRRIGSTLPDSPVFEKRIPPF